jgi:hypothetical protein
MARGDALAVARSLAVRALVALAALACATSASLGCVRPLRMCAAGGDCGPLSSCVAGRCVAHGALPAIATSRRLLFDPIDVGYVRRGEPQRGLAGVTPALATLGRDGARAFLRFSVPLAPEVGVVEAYVLVDRVRAVDADPTPIAVHLVEVLDLWDGRSLSWAVQPRIEELGSPVTRVLPSAATVVRLDARDLVERWRRRRRSDEFGIAIVATGDASAGNANEAGEASGTKPTGMTFALAPREPLDLAGDDPSGRADRGPRGDADAALAPRLELYVR